jgi:hypothetical protein
MQAMHATVRNPRGEPLTEATWKAVIRVLAGVLGELGTPPATRRAGQDHRPDPRRDRHRTRSTGPVSADLDRGVYALLTSARHVIDQHGNDGEHTCRGCGRSWPCFELGTAIEELDLVLRVYVAARWVPDPARQRRPRRPTSAPVRATTLHNDADDKAVPAGPVRPTH